MAMVASKEATFGKAPLGGVRVGEQPERRRKRDVLPAVTRGVIQRIRGHSQPLSSEGKSSDGEAVAPRSFISFLDLDVLLEQSISSMGTNIGGNPKRDWISGNFPQAAVLAELKRARKALRDIGAGEATVELLDGRDDDLGFLINTLSIKGGAKKFPVGKQVMEKRLTAIDQEIQGLSGGGSSRKQLETLSSERMSLVLQITLSDTPNRDYVELETIKGANTSIEGVFADVVHYSFVGVPHSKVTITLSDEMRKKAKDDLQHLPPLAA